MTITISLDELLAWTAEERAKWLAWLKQNPAALDVTVQPGGRFPTVRSLIDHIFVVEVRHTLRLQRQSQLPASTGVAAGDIDGLFAYAARAREGVKRLVPTIDAADLNTPRDIVLADGTYQLSPRKLLIHMTLHEVRHWAQIAAALRAAGHAPPGNHDLFFAKALI